jgi:hypothetical protein
MSRRRFILVSIATEAVIGVCILAWMVFQPGPYAFAAGYPVDLASYAGPSPTGMRGPIAELNPAEVERAVAVSALGAFYSVQQAAKRMIPAGKGAILLERGARVGAEGHPCRAYRCRRRRARRTPRRPVGPAGQHARSRRHRPILC